jgi:hypothetical protein
MMIRKVLFIRPLSFALCSVLFLLFSNPHSLQAQPPQVKLKLNLKNYIRQYSDEAVRQMIKYRIPASVVLAQAIFESGSGTSDLAVKSNNHFGVKCHWGWEGDTITQNDDTLNECFRKYNTVRESYTDHSIFLASRERYAFLFDLPLNDYTSWCYGLKNAGYATYPTYAQDLINLIESEKLYELDNYVNLSKRPANYFKAKKVPDIVNTQLKPTTFTLEDFSRLGVLWLDEKDVLPQSLDMVVDAGDDGEMTASAAK